MRVSFKLALLFMVAIAALASIRSTAEANVVGLSAGGLDASAYVSSFATPAYHHYPRRSRFCHSVRIQCRLDTGHGYNYRRCMERRGCGYFRGSDYSCEYRRKGYGCGYWYTQCIRNWHYREDIEGCLDYHCCGRYR